MTAPATPSVSAELWSALADLKWNCHPSMTEGVMRLQDALDACLLDCANAIDRLVAWPVGGEEG